MTTLYVGSTGVLGKEATLKLKQSADAHVRALLRGGRHNPQALPLADAGVEIIDGDLTRPESLSAALADVDTVICSATSMPKAENDGIRRVDHLGTLSLIEAAESAGAKKFVYVSYSGNIREDSPLETAKRDCEERLLASSMNVVILRPSYFMEMWMSPALGFDPANHSVRIYGSGTSKVSYISIANVADFIAAAALHDFPAKHTILELGGPEALSQLDLVHIFEKRLNTAIRLDHVPIEALEQQHNSDDPVTKTFGALMLSYANGDVIAGTAELANRFGIRLRSVSDFAESSGEAKAATRVA